MPFTRGSRPRCGLDPGLISSAPPGQSVRLREPWFRFTGEGRAANQGARVVALGRDEFRAILKICEALRSHTKDLIKANTASWASGYAEDTH